VQPGGRGGHGQLPVRSIQVGRHVSGGEYHLVRQTYVLVMEGGGMLHQDCWPAVELGTTCKLQGWTVQHVHAGWFRRTHSDAMNLCVCLTGC
jgi:hypothetical protein